MNESEVLQKLRAELTAMRTAASKAMADCETANHALAKIAEERNQLEKERDSLRIMADGLAYIQHLEADRERNTATVDISTDIALGKYIAHGFAALVASSPNYSELTFEPANQTGEKVIVIVQKIKGKTPHQLKAEAEKERDALIAENQWHLASESLPPANTKVVVCHTDYGGHAIAVASMYLRSTNGKPFPIWNQDGEWIDAEGGWNGAYKTYENLSVTHWRKIPQPPKGQP
jgi:hypothetical protein